jgi:hypothetical protein
MLRSKKCRIIQGNKEDNERKAVMGTNKEKCQGAHYIQ